MLFAVNRLAERLQRIVSSDFFTAQPAAPSANQSAARSGSTQDLLSEITTTNPLAEVESSRPQPNGYSSAADSHTTLQQVSPLFASWTAMQSNICQVISLVEDLSAL